MVKMSLSRCLIHLYANVLFTNLLDDVVKKKKTHKGTFFFFFMRMRGYLIKGNSILLQYGRGD